VDNAAAKLSTRLRRIPCHLRAINSLACPDRHAPIVRKHSSGRLSIRHLMILVAVIGVLLGGVRLGQHVSYRRQKTAFHEDMAAFHSGRVPPNMNASDYALLMKVVRRRPEWAVLNARLRDKWQTASVTLWLAVDADPTYLSAASPDTGP
jgi:hypothetical protein